MSATREGWPDVETISRALQSLEHLSEPRTYRNAALAPCTQCGTERATRWRRVAAGTFVCGTCQDGAVGEPDRAGLERLGITGDVATMSEAEWTAALIAAAPRRRT